MVFLCNTVGNDYVYDANKNITNIQYNYLNLPTQVTINGQHIMYTYDATGTKLRKTVNGVTTDYAKGGALKKQFATVFSERASWRVAYENNVLQFFSQPEGYFEPSSPPSGELVGAYVYQYKDHLGNIRLSYSDKNNNGVILASSDPNTNEIVEEHNYYPFGLKHKGYNYVVNGMEYKYKTYQGQEISKELGYNMLEFKYRHYDPAIARFVAVDPLASKYPYNSTYAFQENKLGLGVELEGLELVYRKGASPEFKNKFAKTVKFMNSKGTSGKMAKLNKLGRTELVDNTGNGTFYRRSEGAIYFDPSGGVETHKDHLLSPATLLGHEIDHAVQDKDKSTHDKFINDLNTPDKNYTNKEDRRVITGSEQETALKHGEIKKGEVTREDHGFKKILIMPDPTSTKNATKGSATLTQPPVILKTVKNKKNNNE